MNELLIFGAVMVVISAVAAIYAHNENLAKIEAESENRHIIANLKADKDLQNAINKPKAKIAIFNNEEPTTQDNISKFTILGYEENKQERQKNQNRHKRHKMG